MKNLKCTSEKGGWRDKKKKEGVNKWSREGIKEKKEGETKMQLVISLHIPRPPLLPIKFYISLSFHYSTSLSSSLLFHSPILHTLITFLLFYYLLICILFLHLTFLTLPAPHALLPPQSASVIHFMLSLYTLPLLFSFLFFSSFDINASALSTSFYFQLNSIYFPPIHLFLWVLRVEM